MNQERNGNPADLNGDGAIVPVRGEIMSPRERAEIEIAVSTTTRAAREHGHPPGTPPTLSPPSALWDAKDDGARSTRGLLGEPEAH